MGCFCLYNLLRKDANLKLFLCHIKLESTVRADKFGQKCNTEFTKQIKKVNSKFELFWLNVGIDSVFGFGVTP